MLLSDGMDPHASRQCSYCSLKESVIKQANMSKKNHKILYLFLMYIFGVLLNNHVKAAGLQAIVVHSDSPSVSDAHREKPHSSLLITLGLEGLCNGKADVSVRQ